MSATTHSISVPFFPALLHHYVWACSRDSIVFPNHPQDFPNQKEGMRLTQQSSSRFPNRTSGSANMRNPSTWTFFKGSINTWKAKKGTEYWISLGVLKFMKPVQKSWMWVKIARTFQKKMSLSYVTNIQGWFSKFFPMGCWALLEEREYEFLASHTLCLTSRFRH